MTTPNIDYAKGWQYIARLLEDEKYEQELQRLDRLTEQELDAEMRAAGINPEETPTFERIIAEASARAAMKKSGV